jgi:hypothetical protein
MKTGTVEISGISKNKVYKIVYYTRLISRIITPLQHKFSYIVAIFIYNHFESPIIMMY